MRPRKLKNNGSNGSFDPQVFLDTAGVARKVVEYRRNESIYAQGDAAETVMYIQKGGVKFSVVNGSGKEAVVAMFGPTDFFGEGCMAASRCGWARQQPSHRQPFWPSKKKSCCACCTRSMSYPINSSRICWRTTSGWKRT